MVESPLELMPMSVLALQSSRPELLGEFPPPSPVARMSSARAAGLSIGLPPVIGLASMLGRRLDDRCAVAQRQRAGVARRLICASQTPLPDVARRQDFHVAPLDVQPIAETEEVLAKAPAPLAPRPCSP